MNNVGMRASRHTWLTGLQVPTRWSHTKIKHLVGFSSGYAITSESIETHGTYPVYGANGLRGYTARSTHVGSRPLIGRVGALCGNVHLVEGEYWASEHALVGTLVGPAHLRWLGYLLSAMNLGQYSQATAQPVIAAATIENLEVEVPPLVEQRQIANFLDRETAKIDALIGKQEQLIEMLRDRRLSMITSAVSGDTDLDLWETGSPWYPLLPAGWQAGRVKSVALRITDGAHISPDTEGGVYDFVSTRDVRQGQIDFAGSLKTTPETYEYMVRTGCQPRAGDVLYSKDGTVGETAVIQRDRDFVVASSLVIITPDRRRVRADFLGYVFASKTAREQAASFMRGAGLPRLSVGNLARVEVPLPPVAEQQRIVDYLDGQTSKIEVLIKKAQSFIALSRERRSALISAAVTGQIDVRDEVDPHDAQAVIGGGAA